MAGSASPAPPHLPAQAARSRLLPAELARPSAGDARPNCPYRPWRHSSSYWNATAFWKRRRWLVDCKIEGGSTRAERLPVPRVASEASVVRRITVRIRAVPRRPKPRTRRARSRPCWMPLPTDRPDRGQPPQAGAVSRAIAVRTIAPAPIMMTARAPHQPVASRREHRRDDRHDDRDQGR